MYNILKYILYTALFLLFFSTPWVISFLAQYNQLFADIKTNLIDNLDPALWTVFNLFLLALIIRLFRES